MNTKDRARSAGRQWARDNFDVDALPSPICREMLSLFEGESA